MTVPQNHFPMLSLLFLKSYVTVEGDRPEEEHCDEPWNCPPSKLIPDFPAVLYEPDNGDHSSNRAVSQSDPQEDHVGSPSSG